MAAKFEIYPDKGGHYRWRLVSSNGQTTATSGEGFSSHANAKRAAEGVKEHAATAEIVDAES
ncbi:MAG: DUF1508 domain-containing protein [Solirubrobacterales bacterium]|nr:DUF1508 domain-containing protein [Solirubrobacterales bacterium]